MFRKIRSIMLCLFILFLAACNLPDNSIVLTPTLSPEELTPEATETPAATLTPLPERDKVIFIPGGDSNSGISLILQKELPLFCADLRDYEEKPGLAPSDLPADTDYVFFTEGPGNLTEWVNSAPQTRFIITGNKQDVYDGVWTIQYDPGYLPFLVGYAAATNAYDWRCAGLLPSDSAIFGPRMEEAFMNGAKFFCGRCLSNLSPYVNYPLPISLPSGSTADEWNAALNEAQKSIVYTIFLSDEAAQEAVFQNMQSMNVKLLGFSEPPAGSENQWLATINFDWAATFAKIVEQSEAGVTGGLTAPELSVIPGALSENFSEGKTRILQDTYADLLSGLVSVYNSTKEYGSN